MKKRLVVPVALWAILIISGCGGEPTSPVVGGDMQPPNPDPDGDGILGVADACPNQPENFNNLQDGDGCPDVPRDFYVAVKDDIENTWAGVFAFSGLTYIAISIFQAYTQPINSPCGTLVLSNAFYCTVNVGVYYDDNLFTDFLTRIGDAAPAFIIAHEIGHHVGFQLGWWPPLISQKQAELMADCLGGAWLAGVAVRGLLEAGDLQEIGQTLFEIGDPAWTWFLSDLHGTPTQRTNAFLIGFLTGAPACTDQSFIDLFPTPPASN